MFVVAIHVEVGSLSVQGSIFLFVSKGVLKARPVDLVGQKGIGIAIEPFAKPLKEDDLKTE